MQVYLTGYRRSLACITDAMADFQPSSTEPPPLTTVDEAPQPVSDVTGLPRNVAAGLASIFILVGGIVFLVLERKDRFVRFYSVQSILLGVVALMVSVAVEVVRFIFTHIPLIGGLLNGGLWLINVAFSLAWFVVYVVMIIKAFTGREWEIPYLGRIAKRQTAVRLS
jgi:uncharacterized membrane protein